ncbi:crossover junction endodeoxyribonuclease RuvC [bacterium TMED277]|nr:MAG: crossover junction endodeoxyribonuclease RuvC [bacterium TMED277]|tara:strand:- start:365 stop:871 length:507 start_codon:yes stop_codon:yes gene_type:complete
MQVIGIDPGLNYTGWGVVSSDGPNISYLGSGVCKTNSKDELSVRLVSILEQLREVLSSFDLQSAAIEKTFVKSDPVAALKLGQARAAAIISVGERNLRVGEYSPNYIKKVVAGRGHATKEDIKRMISIQFPRIKLDRSDESDAIAIALCHLHSSKMEDTLSRAIERTI